MVNPAVSLAKPGTSLYQPGKALLLTETDREIRVTLAADVLFDFDKATIRPDAASTLKQLAAVLREHKPDGILIEGYTDSTGSSAYNMQLSLERAIGVKTWLAQNEGFNITMFSTKGLGANNPVAPNTSLTAPITRSADSLTVESNWS